MLHAFFIIVYPTSDMESLSYPSRGSETATDRPRKFHWYMRRQEQHHQQQPPDLPGDVQVKFPGKSLAGRPPLFGGPPSDPSSLLLGGRAGCGGGGGETRPAVILMRRSIRQISRSVPLAWLGHFVLLIGVIANVQGVDPCRSTVLFPNNIGFNFIAEVGHAVAWWS